MEYETRPFKVVIGRSVALNGRRAGLDVMMDAASGNRLDGEGARASIIAKAGREWDAHDALRRGCNRQAYINYRLRSAGLRLLDARERVAGHVRCDPSYVERDRLICKLARQYDAQRVLQAVCRDRATYVHGTLLAMRLAGLNEAERLNL